MVPVHEDDVTDRELLDELLAERFPNWKGVLNEAAVTRARLRRRRQLTPQLPAGEPEAVVPLDIGDDDLVRRARRRILEDLPGDYGPARQQRPPA